MIQKVNWKPLILTERPFFERKWTDVNQKWTESFYFVRFVSDVSDVTDVTAEVVYLIGKLVI